MSSIARVITLTPERRPSVGNSLSVFALPN